jgi:hypothetical protein
MVQIPLRYNTIREKFSEKVANANDKTIKLKMSIGA